MKVSYILSPGSIAPAQHFLMYLFICSFSQCSLLSIVVLFFNWHVLHFFTRLELREARQACYRNAFDCVKVRLIQAGIEAGGSLGIFGW